MARDIVYFDLETQRTAGDVGGWSGKAKMGMSIGVTYSTAAGQYRIFREKDADALVQQLLAADLVVGFNQINFDYEVLMAYTIFDLREQLRSLDLMVELERSLDHRPKLEAVAIASLGVGKTADGLQAIRWWQEGNLREIARYCCFDVKVTKMIHEYGVQHGHVKYVDKFGRVQAIPVDWGRTAKAQTPSS
ncbi:MAG: DEAD/DEAH box helicase domain-containing protein [Verrucomicrobia bacterium]|jgi:DEAD/DEAH box helicase domain-containing protein|nr:MAG: DEAD/DEAH box helicase domain-containing protein [Verrucomicrobiota bacterium]